VIAPADGTAADLPYQEYGVLVNSGEYSGHLPSEEARSVNGSHAPSGKDSARAAITYRIKDWGISRQAVLGVHRSR